MKLKEDGLPTSLAATWTSFWQSFYRRSKYLIHQIFRIFCSHKIFVRAPHLSTVHCSLQLDRSKAHSPQFPVPCSNLRYILKWCSINVGLSCSCIVGVLNQILIAPSRSSSSSSLRRRAHHLRCAAVLIIFFALSRSSYSLRHRNHLHLHSIKRSSFLAPSCAQDSWSRCVL